MTRLLALILAFLYTIDVHGATLGTAFTYQARLSDSGAPYVGTVDLSFRLYDAQTLGNQLGSQIDALGLTLTDGLITVDLDFGVGVFTGDERWLEIDVNSTTLSPRQPLMPAPYALFALSGNEGPVGPEGPEGPQGPQGIQGPEGAEGAQGIQGIEGPEGPQGVQGIQGNDGPQGPIGPDGPQGPIGPAGPAGSDALWLVNVDDMYFNAGKVGVGTDTPQFPLHAIAPGGATAESPGGPYVAVYGSAVSGNGVVGFTGSTVSSGVWGKATSPTGFASGVQGESDGDSAFGVTGRATGFSGTGVRGAAIDAAGSGVGVEGIGYGPTSIGVKARVLDGIGVNYGLRASTASSSGYAGYFEGGKNYFDGPVGIGILDPTTMLDVRSSAINPLIARVSANGGIAIQGFADGDTSGYGVVGSGPTVGVDGTSNTSGGIGVRGTGSSDFGIGVWGSAPGATAYGGYFIGRGYFSEAVGIGTDAPNSMLSVVGDVDISGPRLHVGTDGDVGIGTSSPSARLHLRNNDTQVALKMRASGSWTAELRQTNNSELSLVNGGSERLTIEAGGNVGIGTFNPGYLLEVNGSAGKPGGGSWTSTSDQRLKKNIEPLHGSLESLLNLRGVTFEYIDPDAINELPGTRIGMIAQDVETVFPDWVDVGADGFRRLTFRGFEALTVEALRELHQKNADLRHENDELRRRLERLESMVDQITRQNAGQERE